MACPATAASTHSTAKCPHDSQQRPRSKTKDGNKSSDITLQRIPQPSPAPVVGNLSSIDLDDPSRSFMQLAARHGPIYRLSILGHDMVVLSSWKLVNEACDDERFQKSIKGELEELRNVVHDGLFTSTGEREENWGVAHRVLVSAFGPLAIRGMFDEMHEVVSQLVLKWARMGPATRIDVGEDFTRLTLDTVALTSMGFRFNSYYNSSDLHPFIKAMYDVLTEVGKKGMRFLPSMFYASETKKYHKNIALLRKTAREVVRERKDSKSPDGEHQSEDGSKRKDLLTAMLETIDAKTGRKMTEESVIDNLITFLVAGHETTAATLQFTMYNLLKHPDKYQKLQAEIDSVVGTGAISIEHVTKLKYLDACIRETLRLSVPIFAFAREAKSTDGPCEGEVILDGKYRLKKGEQIVCLLSQSHLDKDVWGPDAEEFVPERMLEGGFEQIQERFPHSWSPFGTGMRACIGRAFAWQEMMLAFAALLQSFNFVMDDPTYTLQTQTALTIRPKDFYIRASPRGGLSPLQLEARLVGAVVGNDSDNANKTYRSRGAAKSATTTQASGHKMAIYYGSNSGTCEFMARRLAQDASGRGFQATVEPLDAGKEALPKGVPVVIVTASYEGQPPNNAGQFVQWIEAMPENGKDHAARLEGVTYAVWGCGHSDWAKTYQRIPRLLDSQLSRLGGRRLVAMGETDAKVRDMFSDFETWQDELLWPAVHKQLNIKSHEHNDDAAMMNRLKVSFSTPRTALLRPDVQEGLVVQARSLTGPAQQGHEEKRHLEIRLPEGSMYAAGDYLAVLPHNPRVTVARVLRRFHLAWDAHVAISSSSTTTLPTSESIPVSELLSSYVELGQVATRKDVCLLSKLAHDDIELKNKLAIMAGDGFEEMIRAKQLSVLGILEAFPTLVVPFNVFLSFLPPMRVRQYSISSSPLASPDLCSLTFSVIDRPATSGVPGQRHIGVASSYLASLKDGDKVQVAVRKAAKGFRLPPDPHKTPIICIGAGTGLAPFRAFVQERVHLMTQKEPGETKLAPAVLFYGCRDREVDDLYRDEFDAWEKMDAVQVFRAYSRPSSQRDQDSEGCKYVQDRLWRERSLVGELWTAQSARIYVCGAGRIVEGIKDAMVRIIMESKAMSYEESLEELEHLEAERFVKDIFD